MARRKFYQYLSNLDYRPAKSKRGNKAQNEAIVNDKKSHLSAGSNSKILPPDGLEVEPKFDEFYAIFFRDKKSKIPY